MISRRSLFTLDVDRPRPDSTADRWLRVHRTAMACRVEVTLAAADSRFVQAAGDALNEADRVEALLTAFRDSSELSRVNREAAFGCAAVDDELFALLQRCVRLHGDTDGAFDITSTPLSRCWGFLQREPRVPPDRDIEAARELVGMPRVALDPPRGGVRFDRAGMEITLNAIGKGYALDRMACVLRRHGCDHALLSAGGSSVLAIGGRAGGWIVDIRSPLLPRRSASDAWGPRPLGPGRIARLLLRNGALGTSGAGEQFVVEDGTRYGHVIDPRTGWPATGVLSASVVTHEAATADALSTAFLIGGPDLARCYCDAHRDTLALLTLDDGAMQVCGQYAGATM